MTPDADPNLDDQFASRLLECDEALADGRNPAITSDSETPELRSRLERGIACVRLLQQLRPQRTSIRGNSRETADLAAAVSATKQIGSEPSCPTHLGQRSRSASDALGAGGFGIVYLAYDPVLCREIALKIPRADALVDAECRARFQREARAAAALDHPNLVPVHEAGQLGPVCYIALAYCPGSNLSEWLAQREAPVQWEQAARLVAMLAEAIHYAHTRGVLHRDLKPSNVLLSPGSLAQQPTGVLADSAAGAKGSLWMPEPGTGFVPRITDFGMAKFALSDQGQTQTGAILGTPSYMAPEQADGRSSQVGPVTDVYALGAILYEVLTGRPPFWTDTPLETLLQVKSAEPVAPSRLRPRLPRDLETICLKCLHKDPRKRYTGAEDLGDDLRRFLAGHPIQGRRTSLAEQVLKWARRRPGLAAAISALILVTALGVGGILQQWQATQKALANENKALGEAQQALHAEAAERAQRRNHPLSPPRSPWRTASGREAISFKPPSLLDECDEKMRVGSGLTCIGFAIPFAHLMHDRLGSARTGRGLQPRRQPISFRGGQGEHERYRHRDALGGRHWPDDLDSSRHLEFCGQCRL